MSDVLELLESLDNVSLELSKQKLPSLQKGLEEFREKHGRNPWRPSWVINSMIPQISEKEIKKP